MTGYDYSCVYFSGSLHNVIYPSKDLIDYCLLYKLTNCDDWVMTWNVVFRGRW
jgi:hypothetical protein